MQMPDCTFEANLLCHRHSEDTEIKSLKGSDCCLQFLHDLDDLTEVSHDDCNRPVIVIFHNLKVFDGMFLLEELYKQQRVVDNQLTVGAKCCLLKADRSHSKIRCAFYLCLSLRSQPPLIFKNSKKLIFHMSLPPPKTDSMLVAFPISSFMTPMV